MATSDLDAETIPLYFEEYRYELIQFIKFCSKFSIFLEKSNYFQFRSQSNSNLM